MNRGQAAKENFEKGYNCTQSVVLAFKDVIGLDEKTVAVIAQPFGAGMGRLREVCGAFSGILFVLGAVFGCDDPNDYEKKSELYGRVQELAKKFEEENGSIVCRELLGLNVKHSESQPEKRTEKYYKKRPCAQLVYYAASLLEDYLEENKAGGFETNIDS